MEEKIIKVTKYVTKASKLIPHTMENEKKKLVIGAKLNKKNISRRTWEMDYVYLSSLEQSQAVQIEEI